MAPGQPAEVSVKLKTDVFYVKTNSTSFWYLDIEVFRDVFTRLAKGSVTFTSHSDTHLEGKVNGPRAAICCSPLSLMTKAGTSQPMASSVSWSKRPDSLLAVKLPAGEHELVFDYLPDYVVQGRIISTIGFIAFVALTIGEKIVRERRNRRWAESFSLETPII